LSLTATMVLNPHITYFNLTQSTNLTNEVTLRKSEAIWKSDEIERERETYEIRDST